jgi:hypothetical protein
MHVLRLLVVLTIGLVAALPARAADEAPVLAVLEFSSGLLGKNAKILASPGAARSPFAGKAKVAWVLREGKTLQQPTPPAERLIQFYQVTDKDPIPVCAIAVRYTRDARGWRPAYQLVPPPAATWDGKQFIPIETGLPGSVRVLRATGSNADGYVSSLSFGSHSGPIQIDLWEVQ